MPTSSSGLHVVEHVPSHGFDANAPVVVLVHGSLDRGTSFARVVRRLHDLRVVTYDRRGYHRSRDSAIGPTEAGLSRPSASPSASAFECHVADLLAVVGGRRSVAIGHSLGGDVALGAALEDPGTVRAVGVYEPPLPWTDWWPKRGGRDPSGEDPAKFAESFFRRVVSDEAWERLTEHAREERRADGAALVAEMADLRRGRAPFDLSVLEVPIVLGRGERSIPHHRRAIDALKHSIPDAEVFEIAGASHGAHLTHPDAFAQMVRAVVARAS